MSQESKRHHLEVQALRIQQVLARHGLPGQVVSGETQGLWARFDLQTQISAGRERWQALKAELKVALGVPDVQIGVVDGHLRIQVSEPTGPPVPLLELLERLPSLPPVTTTLGLSPKGIPVVLNLVEDNIGHILVAGGSQAGKTALLRSMALSLGMTSRQSQVQLAAISPHEHKGAEELRLLNYIPHMLLPLVRSAAAIHDALGFLDDEMRYRLHHRRLQPAIVVLVDELESVLAAGGQPTRERLASLLQSGGQAGIYLALSTNQPLAGSLGELVKSYLGVRLVGRVRDSAEARAATGVRDSEAEALPGKGAFVAAAHGELLTEFQAAYVNEEEMLPALERLQRQAKPVLRARPFSTRPSLPRAPDSAETVAFQVRAEDGGVTFHV